MVLFLSFKLLSVVLKRSTLNKTNPVYTHQTYSYKIHFIIIISSTRPDHHSRFFLSDLPTETHLSSANCFANSNLERLKKITGTSVTTAGPYLDSNWKPWVRGGGECPSRVHRQKLSTRTQQRKELKMPASYSVTNLESSAKLRCLILNTSVALKTFAGFTPVIFGPCSYSPGTLSIIPAVMQKTVDYGKGRPASLTLLNRTKSMDAPRMFAKTRWSPLATRDPQPACLTISSRFVYYDACLRLVDSVLDNIYLNKNHEKFRGLLKCVDGSEGGRRSESAQLHSTLKLFNPHCFNSCQMPYTRK